MSVGDEIWMVKTLQQLNFHKDLFQPSMIVADRDPLACKFAKWHTIQDMFHQEYYTSAPTT